MKYNPTRYDLPDMIAEDVVDVAGDAYRFGYQGNGLYIERIHYDHQEVVAFFDGDAALHFVWRVVAAMHGRAEMNAAGNRISDAKLDAIGVPHGWDDWLKWAGENGIDDDAAKGVTRRQ